MIYRLKEQKGDAIAVPQLVFSKLGIAEEYNVRVALYVLATGVTDPEKICADLKLRSKMSAESALAFWAGAGLLERYEENAAPGEEPSAPAPMTWAEIAAASRTDPMISSLIDCAQAGFARPLTHSEMEKLVNLYIVEGFAPETVMLCVAYVASRGKRTMGAVSHELKVWRAEVVESGEQADAHLQLLALRAQREQYVSGLLGIAESELTLGGRKAIARWYEVYGYDDAMVEEAVVQAGAKRDLWYWNSILKTWNAKGLRTVHDVRGPVAGAGASRNIRVDREAPSGNDFLKNAARRRPLPRIPRLLAHFPAAALAELAQQQDQAHRPGHGKHHRDEYPRTQVVIVLFRRLRLKTVVLIVFVAHASPSPFPRSFRLLPFSSTI